MTWNNMQKMAETGLHGIFIKLPRHRESVSQYVYGYVIYRNVNV